MTAKTKSDIKSTKRIVDYYHKTTGMVLLYYIALPGKFEYHKYQAVRCTSTYHKVVEVRKHI